MISRDSATDFLKTGKRGEVVRWLRMAKGYSLRIAPAQQTVEIRFRDFSRKRQVIAYGRYFNNRVQFDSIAVLRPTEFYFRARSADLYRADKDGKGNCSSVLPSTTALAYNFENQFQNFNSSCSNSHRERVSKIASEMIQVPETSATWQCLNGLWDGATDKLDWIQLSAGRFSGFGIVGGDLPVKCYADIDRSGCGKYDHRSGELSINTFCEDNNAIRHELGHAVICEARPQKCSDVSDEERTEIERQANEISNCFRKLVKDREATAPVDASFEVAAQEAAAAPAVQLPNPIQSEPMPVQDPGRLMAKALEPLSKDPGRSTLYLPDGGSEPATREVVGQLENMDNWVEGLRAKVEAVAEQILPEAGAESAPSRAGRDREGESAPQRPVENPSARTARMNQNANPPAEIRPAKSEVRAQERQKGGRQDLEQPGRNSGTERSRAGEGDDSEDNIAADNPSGQSRGLASERRAGARIATGGGGELRTGSPRSANRIPRMSSDQRPASESRVSVVREVQDTVQQLVAQSTGQSRASARTASPSRAPAATGGSATAQPPSLPEVSREVAEKVTELLAEPSKREVLDRYLKRENLALIGPGIQAGQPCKSAQTKLCWLLRENGALTIMSQGRR